MIMYAVALNTKMEFVKHVNESPWGAINLIDNQVHRKCYANKTHCISHHHI